MALSGAAMISPKTLAEFASLSVPLSSANNVPLLKDAIKTISHSFFIYFSLSNSSSELIDHVEGSAFLLFSSSNHCYLVYFDSDIFLVLVPPAHSSARFHRQSKGDLAGREGVRF